MSLLLSSASDAIFNISILEFLSLDTKSLLAVSRTCRDLYAEVQPALNTIKYIRTKLYPLLLRITLCRRFHNVNVRAPRVITYVHQSQGCDIRGARGGYPYRTIMAALQGSNSGDTVCICAGTYTEAITLVRPVNMVGEQVRPAVINHNPAILVPANLMEGASIRNMHTTGRIEADSTHRPFPDEQQVRGRAMRTAPHMYGHQEQMHMQPQAQTRNVGVGVRHTTHPGNKPAYVSARGKESGREQYGNRSDKVPRSKAAGQCRGK